MQVCELIELFFGDWIVELVNSLFPFYVAHKILKIKILPTLQLDKLIWPYEKRGVYSVKSAYHRVFEETIPTLENH